MFGLYPAKKLDKYNMNVNKLVVFDLDGTLNKTELYAVPAHKKALADYNIFDKSDELIISTFGAPGMDAVHLLVNSDDPEIGKQYLKKASQYEQELIEDNCGEYEGVTDMLIKLKENGYHTAVCSNASERYIKMVLNALKIIEHIDFIQPLVENAQKSDTLRMLLNKVNPQHAIMVGDRIYDKIAAKDNNLQFVGCLYGFNQSEVADADFPVLSPRDILNVVNFAFQ